MLICLVLWGLKPLQGVSKLLALAGAKSRGGGGGKKTNKQKQNNWHKSIVNNTGTRNLRSTIWHSVLLEELLSNSKYEKQTLVPSVQKSSSSSSLHRYIILKCAQVKVTLFKTQTQCMNGHCCWFLCAEDKGWGVVLPHYTILLPSSTYDTMLS